MTPQLQQAIKLLQLSNVELASFVEAELERNPLLERADPDETGRAAAEPADEPWRPPRTRRRLKVRRRTRPKQAKAMTAIGSILRRPPAGQRGPRCRAARRLPRCAMAPPLPAQWRGRDRVRPGSAASGGEAPNLEAMWPERERFGIISPNSSCSPSPIRAPPHRPPPHRYDRRGGLSLAAISPVSPNCSAPRSDSSKRRFASCRASTRAACSPATCASASCSS